MKTSTPARAGFSFFLHSHLPWVMRHGRWPHGVEWLHEATLATYLPLIAAGRRLGARGLRGGLTISISPILGEQLAHPLFAGEMRAYLEERVRTSTEEARRFESKGDDALARLARRAQDSCERAIALLFDELRGDLLGAFADLARSGVIELATCGATHGYFPLLGRDESIALQIRLARTSHEARFGQTPRGMWLPEAAYRPAGWWNSPSGGETRFRPGVEEFLARESVRYVIVDSALLLAGRAASVDPVQFAQDARSGEAIAGDDADAHGLDPHSAYWIARAGDAPPEVACYVRDPSTALQVWSRERGYPGDPAYLEFHKKSDGGGHRYWRVTGADVDLGEKGIYDPDLAAERVRSHADHFAGLVRTSLAGAPASATLVAPFDAELFGHWWAEGVDWLEGVLTRLASDSDVALESLADRLERNPPRRAVHLPEGSWGKGGGHEVWRNPNVDWTWAMVHRAEDEVWSLVDRARRGFSSDARRIALAALRQLLLASASDWQFLMTTGSAVDYATERLRLHAEDALHLAELGRRVVAGQGLVSSERRLLEAIEARDDPFPDLASVVNLDERLRANGASDPLAAKSFRREAFVDRSRRVRPSIHEG